jgi:hypothetical protein
MTEHTPESNLLAASTVGEITASRLDRASHGIADADRSTAVPLLGEQPWLVALLFLGFTAAMIGAYWDAETHTNVGRDSFWILPHIAIYSGITGAGTALMLWAAQTARLHKTWMAFLSHPPMTMAGIAAAVILVAAPIDNAWHAAFSRDAVLWSPPHLLGVVSAVALPTSALLEMARLEGKRRLILMAIAGAFTIAGLVAVVTEYETDVPQFAEWLYLPILCGVTALAFTFVQKASRARWAATVSAAIYLAFMLATSGFLLAVNYAAPVLPLLFIPAALSDWLLLRGAPSWLRGLLHALVLFAVYVPYLDFVRNGMQILGGDIVVGLPVAILASWLAYSIVPARPTPRGAHLSRWITIMALTLAAFALFATPALAHDPGQGPKVGRVQLTATVVGDRVQFRGDILTACGTFAPTRMAARRAGVTLHAPLSAIPPCGFAGTMRLRERGRSRGRWFVYAELAHRPHSAETWLLVSVGGARSFGATRFIYTPPARHAATTIKVVSSIIMYAVIVILMGLVLRLARRFDPAAPPQPTAA